MIKSKFTEISKLFNYDYEINEFTVDGSLGSKISISIHKLELKYQNTPIKIIYEFGNSNVAEIKLIIELNEKCKNFKITTSDNFWRLISFNKNVWNIYCKNQNTKNYLFNSLKNFSLTKMAENSTFEPIIKGQIESNYFIINTKFYLGFKNKEESILPIINFHKSLIEYFQN